MTDQTSVLLFFIDGLGIGRRETANPLHGLDEAEPLAVFQDEPTDTLFEGIVVPTDPRLGIEGRPQSASGQTTILTGINAPGLIGYHKQGFPNAELRKVIAEKSLFLRLKNAGIENITFANAYRPRFFLERPRWVSATTAAVEAAGLQFRNIDDLVADRAVYQDFTNQFLIDSGLAVPTRSPRDAARVLADIANGNRFTLYEYFMTDKMGHSQNFEGARSVLSNLGRLIRELLQRLDLQRTTVILTSDHGNIEDLSIRNHTLNDVPTIIWGAARERMARQIRSLADITPAIINTLTSHSVTV
jgi:hypothetical protein